MECNGQWATVGVGNYLLLNKHFSTSTMSQVCNSDSVMYNMIKSFMCQSFYF